MVTRKDLLTLNFYKTTPFTGSVGSMRYRVEKVAVPIAGASAPEGEEPPYDTLLQASAWHGPFAFHKTPDSEKLTFQAPFSEEGLEQIVAWLNQQV